MIKYNCLGRIANDLELQTSPTGVQYLNVTVVTNRVKNGEKIGDFFNMVAFKGTAENIAKFFKKGDMIYVDGTLSVDKYEKDGKTLSKTVFTINSFDFCGSAKKENDEVKVDVMNDIAREIINVDDDSLPF